MGSKLVKNSIIYAVGDIAPRLLGFISFPILTSYLVPAQYAIASYVNTVVLFLTTIGFLCLNTYYLVFYYKQKTQEDRERLLGNLTVFVMGLNLFLTLLMLTIGPFLFGLLESNIAFYPYIAIGVITNFFGLFAILPTALFRLEERPLPLTLLNVAKGVLVFGVTVTLVVGFGFKAEGILYSQMIVTIIFGLIFLHITLKNMRFTFDWGQIRTALLFSLPLLPGSISYLLTSMFDRILIDKYLNLTDLGIYSSASTLALVLNIVAYGAYKAFEPYIFKTYGTKNFTSGFIKLRNGLFIVLISGAFGIALFAKEFFLLFSETQYHHAYYYVPVIIIGVMCSGLGMPYSTVITARGKTKINSAISICGGLFSVALNIILLTHYGIIAACVISALTYFLIMTADIYFSNIRIPHIRTVVVTIITTLATMACVYFTSIDSLFISIVIKSAVFIVVSIISMHITGLTLPKLKYLFTKEREI